MNTSPIENQSAVVEIAALTSEQVEAWLRHHVAAIQSSVGRLYVTASVEIGRWAHAENPEYETAKWRVYAGEEQCCASGHGATLQEAWNDLVEKAGPQAMVAQAEKLRAQAAELERQASIAARKGSRP